MKKVYITFWQTTESGIDFNHGVGSVYESKELAEQAVKMLEDLQVKRVNNDIEQGIMYSETYTWTIQEFTVLNFLPPIGVESEDGSIHIDQ